MRFAVLYYFVKQHFFVFHVHAYVHYLLLFPETGNYLFILHIQLFRGILLIWRIIWTILLIWVFKQKKIAKFKYILKIYSTVTVTELLVTCLEIYHQTENALTHGSIQVFRITNILFRVLVSTVIIKEYYKSRIIQLRN